MPQLANDVVLKLSGRNCEKYGDFARVIRYLACGGQGEVYLVRTEKRQDMAVKWYFQRNAIEELSRDIRELIQRGAPRNDPNFVWPLAYVTHDGNPSFGYLMEFIDTGTYKKIGAVIQEADNGGRTAPPWLSFPVLCELSYQICTSYRNLHLSGFCYRDVNEGNVLIDVQNGGIKICDNDNVAINRGVRSNHILGTWAYMAPEVARLDNPPSASSDLHSLAVFLFKIWCYHGPFDGLKNEYRNLSRDNASNMKIAQNPGPFIFHPTDHTNHLPKDGSGEYILGYARPAYLWKDRVPSDLKNMFCRVFIDGLNNPENRPPIDEWRRLFLNLQERILFCPHCKERQSHRKHLIIWDPKCSCDACGHSLKGTPHAILTMGNVPIPFVTSPSPKIPGKTKLYLRHVKRNNFLANQNDRDPQWDVVIGEFQESTKHPGSIKLVNISSRPWTVTYQKQISNVDPGKGVTLMDNMLLTIEEMAIRVSTVTT